MKKEKVLVIIPTYCERENIEKLIIKIHKIFKSNRISGKIAVVDDNSQDGTGKIADKLRKKHPVIVIHRFRDRGYGKATISGIKKGLEIHSDIIITMDADFSHDPKVIPIMVKEIQSGYDVVIGSRKVEHGKIVGWSLWRYFCSSGARWFSSFMLGLKTRDVTSGFRAYDAKVFKSIPLEKIKSNGYSFLEELLFYIEKNKFKIKEVPILFNDRRYGKSKLSKIEIIKFFFTIFKIKFRDFFKL